MPLTNGELFEQIRGQMVRQEVPEQMSRENLWAAVSIVYNEMLLFADNMRDSKEDRGHIRRYLKIIAAVVGLLVVFHLSSVAQFAEAAWKWFVGIL